MLKIDARSSKIGALGPSKLFPEALKIEVGAVPESQDAPKRCPRPAKRHPRVPKRRPRGAQERPRDAQETPKRRQETLPPSKIEPGKARNASRPRSGAIGEHVVELSSKKVLSETSANQFRSFFSMSARSVNLHFYRPCRCFRRFFTNACRSTNVSATSEKTSKHTPRKPLKPSPDTPGTLQNRPRSAPEH